MTQDEIDAFWTDAKILAGLNPTGYYTGTTPVEALQPPAWSFGASPQQADELLQLVLAGVKTATASALWDYEAEDDPLPTEGTLSIVLDGAGHPKALIRTTAVGVVPFDQVDEAHAHAEGEGDRSLAHWRREHERFFSEHASHEKGFTPDMPVVLEHFEVLVPVGLRRDKPRFFGR